MSKYLGAGPPDEAAILFICLETMAEMPIEMRLDDRLDKFRLAICNFGLESAKPFVATGGKGEKLSILYESDDPLTHHQTRYLSWVRPPTLREFFRAFRIEPDKQVIVEFNTGHRQPNWWQVNDMFWWKVNPTHD